MEPIEIIDIIAKGESSTVQFKERLPHPDSLAQEMAAFSNTEGGIIILGVNDKTGALNGLSFQEIQSTNRQLVDVATHKVFPPINIKTETVTANGQNIIVVYINEGPGKPYKDHNGIIFVKNGSDKRKVISNEELMRILQSSGNIAADEEPVANTTNNDIDIDFFKSFVQKKTGKSFDDVGQSLPQILNNMGFAKNDKLTLAGLLLFGKKPQAFKPIFSVQCIAFVGNDVAGKEYRDSEPPFEGNLSALYDKTMNFILRNLRRVQVEKSFNSLGELEIPKEALEELVVNSLIHRDYFIKSAIKVFIFDNRIEIISPGKLPNRLTIEQIKLGTSIVRNAILFSNARYLLPYIGVGSGIPRALNAYPKIDLVNDADKELFIAVIHRT
ncbi:MAG: putative DNA binding domain-containing protein [Bacteroidetes bacterium]|nr:putative DNA binding domain-containing protein [Bacteroidota bacterium]MBU2586245.1 putative DNA binding domain-containing protein [Bacteroidota bacterium]